MSDGWRLTYDGLDPDEEGLREALCTLGNGVFATRGAAEEQSAGRISYPGTYLAGGYDELESEVAGRHVTNEDLVNFPNWLWLTFRPAGGRWLDPWSMEVLEYRQVLDLHGGVLSRKVRVRDERGRQTLVESRRFVHMGDPRLAGLAWRLVPENWSGELEVRSGLDGSVSNAGVARYRQLNSRHLEILGLGPIAPEGVWLRARTRQSHIEVGMSARTRMTSGAELERRLVRDDPARSIVEELRSSARQGEGLTIEKIVAVVSSRDPGVGESGVASRLAVREAPGFEDLLESHRAAWARLWRRSDIEIEADGAQRGEAVDQLALRLHVFHMLQTASPHTADRDAGIPARGWHGEAYRGHVFWDELFILPFYVMRFPAVARAAALYRFRRLNAARAIAREAGHAGAAFPWQSGSDGREATQQMHLNPESGRWDPDHSHLQRHVSAAVVYDVWSYFQATADRAFMEEFGAELVLEVARFFSSLARLDASSERYDIDGVMGPDEYHEKYPGAQAGGLRNNAYTNVTAAWCLARALEVLDIVSRERRSELLEMLEIDGAELARWDDVSRRLRVVFHDGVISQFEGYADLEELDWAGYRARYGRIERLDRILKAEGTTPDRFKVSKQPDVLMLLYLFGIDELRALFSQLGYELDEGAVRRNIEYYQARTSHGSTLSKVVFTSIVHRQDCAAGCELFLAALGSDLYDVQGGTTPEGVHLGAMGGTVDIVTRHYAGVELTRDGVRLSPDMPPRIRRLKFRIQHRGRWYTVELVPDRLRASVDDAEPAPVSIRVYDRAYELEPGRSLEVPIEPLARTKRRPPPAPGAPARPELAAPILEGLR